MFSVVVLLQNGLGNGIVVISNVVTAFEYHIWKRNVACVCGEL